MVISTLFALIVFFPSMYNIFSVLYYKDIIINYENYEKKYITIDSLDYINNNGSDVDKVNGYSKQLNNYKTKILLGKIINGTNVRMEGMDDKGIVRRFVWYRSGIDFAFPAKKEDTIFPAKNYLHKKLKIPTLWLLSLITSVVTYKISKKK